MNEADAKIIIDKIVEQVFGVSNPLSLQDFVDKFTFDIKLPQKVKDSTDGSVAWAQSVNPTKFLKQENARTGGHGLDGVGLYATEPIKDLNELLSKWESINYTTTDFSIDSINVGESDLVMNSENVFHSLFIDRCKSVVYSEAISDSDFIAASQRSAFSTYCIRADDSVKCANSFGVSRSAGMTNCIMMHDCGNMQDSMFCSNMNGRQYCIANMQFEKAEYERLRKEVIDWILTPSI